jgi:hypothetical protein
MVLGAEAGHRLLSLVGIGQDAVIVQVACRHLNGDIPNE